MATSTVTVPTPPKRRNSALRRSTVKPPATQAAIVLKRAKGQSKVSIAKDLGIAPNTVSSVLALSSLDEQMAEYRKDAMGLVPLAITAVRTDLQIPGNGSLGLRVMESVGIVGDNAIAIERKLPQRNHGAINLLVQANGGNVTVSTDTVTLTPAHDNASLHHDNVNVTLDVDADHGTAATPATEAPKRGDGA